MGALRKKMRCVMCSRIILADVVQARLHGWTVWLGGALCKDCRERGEAASKPPDPTVFPVVTWVRRFTKVSR